jgi:TatD DNase family protein
MEFVDTHCHIQSLGLDEGEPSTRELWAKAPGLTQDEVVSEATAAGVSRMVVVGCTLDDSKLAIACAAKYDVTWASIGIHPHEAKNHLSKDTKLQFASLLKVGPFSDKIVAIGECGLDYYYGHSPKEDQIAILKFQIELALEHNLPLIFHVREASGDFWPLFEQYKGIRGVLHSYTDNQANLAKAVQHGLYIGVNGIATFAKNAEQIAVYKAIPSEHLLLETDAPFLTPVPHRGTICKPKHVRDTAGFLAELRGESLESLAGQTTQNAQTLFRLS